MLKRGMTQAHRLAGGCRLIRHKAPVDPESSTSRIPTAFRAFPTDRFSATGSRAPWLGMGPATRSRAVIRSVAEPPTEIPARRDRAVLPLRC